MGWFRKRESEECDDKRETIDLMKQMLLKEKNDMDFICTDRPQVKMKRKSETAKGMDFILKD